jgi:hypothetical protein
MSALSHHKHKQLTLGGLELLGLRCSSDTSSESSERNDLLLLLNVGKVGVGLLQVHSWA